MKSFISLFGLADGIIFGLSLSYGLSTIPSNSFLFFFFIGVFTNSIANAASSFSEEEFTILKKIHSYTSPLSLEAKEIRNLFSIDLIHIISIFFSTALGSIIVIIPSFFISGIFSKILSTLLSILFIFLLFKELKIKYSIFSFLKVILVVIVVSIISYLFSNLVNLILK